MTLDKLGRPFQGTVWYWIENSYGTVSEPSLNSLPVSCKIQNIRIDTGDRHKVLRDTGSPLACHLMQLSHEPKVHLEYIPQAGDTLIDDSIDRDNSTCTLQSISMCVGMNVAMTGDTDNVSYYLMDGMKPATVRITGAKDTEYLVVIDYEARSIVTSEIATGTAPAILTGEYLHFNVAGEIRKTGFHVVNTDHIAFITNSVELTVSHKLTGQTDHDSLYKSFLMEGEMDVEGNVDITLDGGGALHVDEVLNNRAFEIVIDMGLMDAGADVPRITLPACQWKNTTVDGNIGGDTITNNVPFTCKPTGCGNLVSTPSAV